VASASRWAVRSCSSVETRAYPIFSPVTDEKYAG
jgi:hypothetical protein